MQTDKAVSVSKLSRNFGKFIAVDEISFEVEKGEIFGFLGANGAGKTTAIKMLCGLLKPTSGEATVAGFSINSESANIKKNIGYMSQKFSLYDDLTVKENIEFYGGIYGLSREKISGKTAQLLSELNLDKMKNSLTRSLPLGWKQRLALSTSLLHDPSIIFLDEPTGGVDPISRRNFWRIIYEIAGSGKTVFVTTHYMDEAEYCNRISIMHRGKIIELGTPTALKQKYDKTTMQDIFIHIVGRN
ncbi:MAG: ABC transporter ATP-binding protein [Desulfobacteraceae bacterium]|jgi:ABC-2 type transport system ATP-binding protein|nr:MAG: ABC transporter ATP-binding protein [Desulfobacteraceae bacterium]